MMSFILTMAWRNLWRQKRRTLITLAAIALGMACLVFFMSLMRGFQVRLIGLGTQTMKGEAQLHVTDYQKTHETNLLISNLEQTREKAQSWRGVRAVTPRLFSPSLAAMGDRSVSVELIGVDPKTEPNISNWKERIWKGRYLEKPGDIMIGKKLAEKLELDIGGKLVLTAADILNGELNSQLFHVSGILWSQNPQLNQYSAIIHLEDAWVLTGTHDAAHEIALVFDSSLVDSIKNPSVIHHTLDSQIPEGLELHDWRELLPEVALMLKFQDFFLMLSFLMIMFLVALGMMNTMGMAIIERIREFGVLQALGTLPKLMVRMVMMEFLLMGICGALFGVLFGWIVTLICQYTGIPLNQVEVSGFVLTEPLYPAMDWLRAWMYAVMFCALIPIFTLIPVQRITKLDTVRALRFS